ncbi:MAG: cobyrinate a,c-diamide synthase [Cyanobacteriota bacterium]
MACLIAAPTSGSGKTLLSLSLAAWARQHGASLQTFKVGPDYLDPQLLSRVSGRPCRNLDPLLCGDAWVRSSFQHHGAQADLALVEGVMGLFDGRGPTSEGSSAAVAVLLDLPVVLVVEASRQAGSVAALVRGFRDHDPRLQLAGVVLNRIGGERHRQLLTEALAAIDVPLLGVLPPNESLALPSRHLGLLPPDEVPDLPQRLAQWADLASRCLDLPRWHPLLQAPPVPTTPASTAPTPSFPAPDPGPAMGGDRPVVIAVARDAAFHFLYPEAKELLEGHGASVIPWSPLADEPLPRDCQAVVLPGGYPELHHQQLTNARRSLGDLAAAAAAGLPIYAECGGLLLLGDRLQGPDDDPEAPGSAMAGVLPFAARRGALSLGYRRSVALVDGLVVRREDRRWGHEFHRWQLQPSIDPTNRQRCPLAARPGLWQLEGWGVPLKEEGWNAPNVHASWLHLHWAGCPEIPRRLVAASAVAAPWNGGSSGRTIASIPPRNAGI